MNRDEVNYLVDFEGIPWESPAPGIRVNCASRGGHRNRLIKFGEGFAESAWCHTGHIGLVIEGGLEIEFEGNVAEFNAGDGLYIPTGESSKHKARVRSGKATLFVVDKD